MSAAAMVEALVEWARHSLQWRGSDDGVVWSEWVNLSALDEPVRDYNAYQGRVLIDGEWRESPVEWAGRASC